MKGRTPSPLRDRSKSRLGSPLRCRVPSPLRSPNSSFRTSTSSFHSALGNSVAYSGAAFAQQDDTLPGRGLYVPMQRGLGPRGPSQRDPMSRQQRGEGNAVRQRGDAGHAHSSSSPPTARFSQVGAQAQVRFSMPAVSYEAIPEDPLDRAVEAHARQLPINSARALLLRRLAYADYEVDGRRVRINWRGSEVMVYAAVEEEGVPSIEPLASYLHRAADHALARAYLSSPVTSFDRPEAPVGRLSSASGPWAPQGGSFILRPSESGSFLLNGRGSEGGGGGSFGGSSLGGGSFYGVHTTSSAAPPPSSASAAAASVQHGGSIQAANPLQRHTSTASFYMRHGTAGDRAPSQGPPAGHHLAAAPGAPPPPAATLPPPPATAPPGGAGQPMPGARRGSGGMTPPIPGPCVALPRAHTQVEGPPRLLGRQPFFQVLKA